MTFEEAQEVMVNYLSGEEFQTRPDANTTVPVIGTLLEMNRIGLITIGSQAGVTEKGVHEDGTSYFMNERSEVGGFMRESQCGAVVDWINSRTDKIAVRVNVLPTAATAINNNINKNDIPAFNPPGSRIAITIEGKNETDVYPFSSVATVIDKETFDHYRRSMFHGKGTITDEDVCIVEFIDPVYGRGATTEKGLFTEVLQAMKMTTKA